MIWASSEVENDSEDNKAHYGDDFDGTVMRSLVRVSRSAELFQNWVLTHAKTNSASPYAPEYSWLASEGDLIRHKIHTGAEHIDEDDHHHTYRDPNCWANHTVPIPYENCGRTMV